MASQEKSLTGGIETYEVDGAEGKVCNPAKTITDCFKFRDKVGLDIAMETLKDGVRHNKALFVEKD
ncbi:hypothetical protein [Fodinibius sp.]|uniref:hypothetical protein n=1 Tax=Fodinibius sp. TaxID=1872440 RepID=UPI003568440C